LTEEQCEMAHGYGSGWGEAGTYELPESCGCYIDQNDGKRYFNRLTGACNQADDGEKLVCLRNALYVTMKSTGKCPTRTGLTEEQCKSADKFGSSWGGADTFDLPETCGCYIDQDGKRYFNRMTGACNDPDDGEISICLENADYSSVQCGTLAKGQGCTTEGEYTAGPASDWHQCGRVCQALNKEGCCEWQPDWQRCVFQPKDKVTTPNAGRYATMCATGDNFKKSNT